MVNRDPDSPHAVPPGPRMVGRIPHGTKQATLRFCGAAAGIDGT